MAHAGSAGNRRTNGTVDKVKSEFWWDSMGLYCKTFLDACAHCSTSRRGERISTPLATAVHGSRPNEFVHYNYLYCSPCIRDYEYLFHLGFPIILFLAFPSQKAEPDSALILLARWMTRFAKMDVWVSDQGAHFNNWMRFHYWPIHSQSGTTMSFRIVSGPMEQWRGS